MVPLTFVETCSLIGLFISIGSFWYVVRRFAVDKSKADADSVEEKTERRVYQELQSKQIAEVLAEVRKLTAKMDDTTILLTRHSEQLSTLFRRMDWVEHVLGKHAQDCIGGTD